MTKKQKELLTLKVNEHVKKHDDSLTVEYITNEMKEYTKASREGRVFCVVDSVAKSGMPNM
jgi:KaiC/GvpD/RAD55 family RecA-like ATPase